MLLAGFIVIGISPRRPLDDGYRGFLDLVAGQITTAIANAQAYEAERARVEALAELDRAKTAFFSNVSHEFRTPLTLMLGPVEELLAKSYTDLPPSAKGQLEIVNRNGLRLLRLVNTLLDFSRIEAGRMQAAYEATDLSAFTAELASSFRSATERAGLTLVVDCPPLDEPVYVDRDMWEKIVLNLLSNAFKFTFEGTITVAVRRRDGSADLIVRDTGVGIPSEAMPRLFERFYRVTNMRSRTHEGSGIGLALVQELAKLHSGSVRATSAIGAGTTFIVTVPLGKDHLPVPANQIEIRHSQVSTATGAAPFVEEALRWLPDTADYLNSAEELPTHENLPVPCPPGDQEGKTDRPSILVVDDNADMRQYIVRLLGERYRVEAATDGEAALTAVHAHRPDLILSDVMMPRMDGLELVRKLRGDPETQLIPVILLSARAGEESRIEGLEHGADDYLVKPFSAREVLARVQAHLELSQVRQKAQQEIEKSRFFLERLAETTPDLLWVYDIVEGKNVYMNRSVTAVLGYGVSEFQLLPGNLTDALVHPDDLLAIRQWYAAFDTTTTGDVREIEIRVRHADGSYRWLLSRATVFERAEGGGTKQILGVSTDITERKQSEQALREGEVRLRRAYDELQATYDQSPIGMLQLDADLRYVRINDMLAGMNGVSAAEHIGKTIHEVVPDLAPKLEAPFRRVIETGSPVVNVELEGETRGDPGTRHTWLESWFPMRDGGGQVVGLNVVAQDITERKRAEQALRDSEEKLRNLADQLEQLVKERTKELVQSQERLCAFATELNLAELRERTRLATELHDHLQQMLVLGKLKLGQGKRLAESLPACAKVIKETDEVLSEALTYTRTLVWDLSPPVLRDHGLAAGLEWLAESMKKHEVAVTVEVSGNKDLKLPEDRAVLLFQSVRELLINSWKHAGTGQATVTMEQRDEELRIEVSDTGVGFDLAAAGAAAAADSPNGSISSKFGLFSIRERMKALGGSFDIQSAVGQGTTATLTLPLGNVRSSEFKVMSSALSEAVNSKSSTQNSALQNNSELITQNSQLHEKSRIRVLLVDDHAMVRQGLRTVLDAYEDVEVLGEASNGEEAVAAVERLRPSLVIMDINMPRMNGIEATAKIKADHPEIVVIGLSVNVGGDNQTAMLKAGAARLLTKEAAVDELYHAIQKALKGEGVRWIGRVRSSMFEGQTNGSDQTRQTTRQG